MTTEAVINTTLQNAIEDWYDRLIEAGATYHTHGSVRSALQDICLDARVSFDALPAPLRELHDCIGQEFARRERGGYPAPNLTAKELLATIRQALS